MTITRDQLTKAIVAEGSRLPVPPPKLHELAERVADRFRLECEARAEPLVKVYDLRHEQDYVYPRGSRRARIDRRTGKAVQRDPADVDTVCVHQTAVEFGVSRRLIEASEGDEHLALARRFLDTPYHVVTSRSGFYVLGHLLTDYTYHAGYLNRRSIGLAVDGNYAGLEDDPETAIREDLRTTWRGEPTVLSDETIVTARALLRHIVDEGREIGMPLTRIMAHRQESANRRADPGEAIWQEVVIWGERELGLDVVLAETLDDGRPIPRQWDARSGARY